MRTYAEDYILDILDEVEERIKKGTKIDNVAAYTLKALKEDWRPRKSQFDIDKEKESLKKKSQQDEISEKEHELSLKQQEEREKLNQIFDNLLEDEKNSIMDEALQVLEKENRYMYKHYQDGVRKGKNLQDMMLVYSSVLEYRDDILKERYIDK